MAIPFRLLVPLAVLPALAFTGNKSGTRDLPKTYRDGFASVPAGVLTSHAGVAEVKGFLFSTTEVSNAQYGAFVADVRARGDMDLLARIVPDVERWRDKGSYNEPYVEHYFTHTAYANYPVVNVSHEGARAYCAWLQAKMDQEADGERSYTVRLPERNEWLYAAKGGLDHSVYAWGGPYLRNSRGCVLANYCQVGDENVQRDPETGKPNVIADPKQVMGVAGAVGDNADITAPVRSYFPNNFGLYNMNGNVAELLADGTQAAGGSWRSPGHDIRNESVMAFSGPSPEVGFRVVVVVQ
ncbi:MAG: SUMF1/EgtB/PvdO family nonheme iron enzyme [Flavobacteriales bacterium]|nr:SUMF1/EgtB/PvdO family nonheme iron enzyme [Flavobacteriales bacterium]